MTVNEEMELSYKLAEDGKKQVRLTAEKSEKIKKNASTKRILYEDYPESFDYVAKIFPGIDVRGIDIFQATPLLMQKMSYDGIGGFFDRITKTVIISAHRLVSPNKKFTVKAKLSKDIIIVHELLHYCHNEVGLSPSMNMKEEFAYGWSLGYMRQKGYTDEEVINDNFMPYLYKVCYKDGFFSVLRKEGIEVDKLQRRSPRAKDRILNPLRSKIHKEIIRLATEKGMEIIRIYSDKIEKGQAYRGEGDKNLKCSVFGMLDFD